MPFAVLFWVLTLAAPMQDEVVQTQRAAPLYADASALTDPSTATNAYQRQHCVFGGQAVACPEPPRPAVAQDTTDDDEAIRAWTTQRDEAAASEAAGGGDVPRQCFFGSMRIAAQGCPPMPPEDPAVAEYRRTHFETPARYQEPAPQPPSNDGCRTETVRSADGMSVSTSVTCGSGDAGLLNDMFDSMRERTEPPSCAMPVQGEDKHGYVARCGGNPY